MCVYVCVFWQILSGTAGREEAGCYLQVEDEEGDRGRCQEEAVEPAMEELEVHVAAQCQVHVVPTCARGMGG